MCTSRDKETALDEVSLAKANPDEEGIELPENNDIEQADDVFTENPNEPDERNKDNAHPENVETASSHSRITTSQAGARPGSAASGSASRPVSRISGKEAEEIDTRPNESRPASAASQPGSRPSTGSGERSRPSTASTVNKEEEQILDPRGATPSADTDLLWTVILSLSLYLFFFM